MCEGKDKIRGAMGFITGIVKRLIKFIIYLTIFAAIVVLTPNLPPYTEFSSIKFESTQPRVGAFTPNTALNNAKKLYLNKVHGPEAFRIFNGELYTGMVTGEVVKISPGGHITFVTKIGKPCMGDWQEHICGRPLGLGINKNEKQLYVVDAYYGIWKVDLKTDKKQLLVSPTVEIEKRVPKIFNSIVLSKNGDFYWTDSSSDFALKDGVYTMLANPTGRLYHYNAAKNQSKVLIDGLWFANGVAMSPDNQYVVVAETAGYSLHRYYIDGPKKGQRDVFVQGLPGVPDNIQILPDGSGMLVGLYTMFDDQHPLLLKSMAPAPLVRKFLARMLKLIEAPFEFANNMYPHYFFEYTTFMIGNFRSMAKLTPPMSGLLHIDWNGKINGIYMNTDLTLQSISDAIVFNEMMYFGSPHSDFIGAVPAPANLLKAFDPKKNIPVKTAETVTEKIPSKKTDSKPEEQTPMKIKEDPVNKAQETEKKAHLKQPSKEAPNLKKPTETIKPTKQPEKEASKPSTPKPQVEQRPTTQIPKKPEPKVSTTTSPPTQTTSSTTNPSSQPKETKYKAQSTTISPQTQTTTPTPKPISPPESNSKVQPNGNIKKQTEKSKEPEIKQKKIDPETKHVDKPKMEATKQASKDTKSAEKSNRDHKEVPEEIPIKEEILSDTIKTDAAKLKVIKKEGPVEIPNPKI